MRATRMLTGLAPVALLVVALVALLPDCASACTCAIVPGSEQERAERALVRSGAVFAGQVVNIKRSLVPEEPGATVYVRVDTVSFRISEVWKGPKRETLEVTTPREGAACGYPFKEDQEYLVYAMGKKMKVDSCGETTPLSEASADLQALGNGETLGGSGVLSDTSGGVPPLGVMGTLGVAVAVTSLLVLRRLVRTD